MFSVFLSCYLFLLPVTDRMFVQLHRLYSWTVSHVNMWEVFQVSCLLIVGWLAFRVLVCLVFFFWLLKMDDCPLWIVHLYFLITAYGGGAAGLRQVYTLDELQVYCGAQSRSHLWTIQTINPACVCLDGEKKPYHLDRTHADTERSGSNLNLWPLCCELLAAAPARSRSMDCTAHKSP